MTDILLTPGGEIDLTNGKMSLVTGADGVGQKVKLKISSFVGDWFLNLLFGIPYWGSVFRHGVNEGDLTQIYGEAVTSTRGVASLDELVIALPESGNRSMGVTIDITTKTGEQINIVTELAEIL